MKEQNSDTRKIDYEYSRRSGPPHRRGKSWFFGIGIDTYQAFPVLHNAVKDVKDLLAVLQEHYHLPGLQVFTLFDEQATRDGIINTLYRLVDEVQPEDSLLLYYSGHGHLHQKTEKGFWIPWDADRESPSKFIANSMIRDFMQDIDSLHTLLISDACFSGSLFVPGKSRSTEAMDSLARLKSRWAICSGRHDELVYDGKPGQNSPFASSIMETLRNYEGTALNAGLLADRVIRMTRANYRQLPIGNPIYEAGDCGGQFVFRRKTAPSDPVANVLPEPKRNNPAPTASAAPTEKDALLDIPPGPMVEGHLIDMSLVHAYARSFQGRKASFKIQEANSLRRKADKEGTATVIDEVDLPSPELGRPIDFWLDTFHQARLHGPRMLGALLLVADDQHFPPEARQARQTLLEKLRNGAYY